MPVTACSYRLQQSVPNIPVSFCNMGLIQPWQTNRLFQSDTVSSEQSVGDNSLIQLWYHTWKYMRGNGIVESREINPGNQWKYTPMKGESSTYAGSRILRFKSTCLHVYCSHLYPVALEMCVKISILKTCFRTTIRFLLPNEMPLWMI